MEEDEPDYSTPIGKVIKHINTLCKKPQIDEQLSEALDLFNEKLDGQEKYLVNGIFKINFSEAALFLQSSATLYGKKIDLLWDQLLEYHTRLIRYDCEHQKEKGGIVDKAVIEKLEERRNRYKRKKKFKLLLQSSETQKLASLIFENEKEVRGKTPHDYDSEDEAEQARAWREIEGKSTQMRKIPCVVYKQMTQHYMLNNYHILKSQDFEILDPEDDEFNTRYSRVPGWHHILHLFEYNDKGLLPDSDNMIATLRLSAYKRIRFLTSRNIPLNTPFEEYKEEYMAYRKQYFEEEAKRWQNMPLDNLEDLRKQLQYLVQKDREERGETTTNEDNIRLGRYGTKEAIDENSCEKIDLLDNSDDDSLFELSFSCNNDFTKSDLFVRLEKLSSDLINTKLRQDSGFFDFSSDSDDDCGNTSELNPGEVSGDVVSAPAVVNNDGTVVSDNGNQDTASAEGTNDVDKSKDSEGVQNKAITDNSGNTGDIANDCGDIDDTRSFVSDHDYCLTVLPLLEADTNADKDVAKQGVSVDKVTVEKENNTQVTSASKETVNLTSASKETVNKPVFAVPRIIPRIIKIIPKKEKAKSNDNKTDENHLPPKRRKLSAKQMEKLLKSKIKPVREQKFEKFFSMNYQPQIGEGEVADVDYESGDSDIENLDEFPTTDVNSEPSRNDDNESVMSEHDYCQRLNEDTHNDSGFIDSSNVSPTRENESNELAQLNADANTSVNKDAPLSEEEEYEKLLAILYQSSDSTNQDVIDLNKTIAERSAEEEQREKERKESQARVEEWRSSITPILRNLKENDFDIHEYGSQIMDHMEVNESKPFCNLVQGKSSAEVVRYFISSLQLANTQNIEICGAQKGRLSNDTFELKLLTKDRYHEHLNAYLAPSEETFREKLERVRAMTAANKRTNSSEPSPKKQKITVVKGKKTKLLNNVKKTYSNSPLHDNIHTVPSLSIELSRDKNIEHQLKKSQASALSEPQLNKEVVQDENNHSLNTYQAKVSSKGKSIIRRPVMSEKSPNTHLHEIDISMPSTSRQYHNPYTMYHRSIAGDQAPSTSSSPDIESSHFNRNYTSNICTSSGEVSPGKRRRDSEDSFRERLIAVQGMNPDIQMQSTPRGGPPPAKQIKTSLSIQKSLLFK